MSGSLLALETEMEMLTSPSWSDVVSRTLLLAVVGAMDAVKAGHWVSRDKLRPHSLNQGAAWKSVAP